MKSRMISVMKILLLLFVFAAATGCGDNSRTALKHKEDTATDGETVEVHSGVLYTIGVAVFDQNNPEMRMFVNYYRDYLEEGFPVKFYLSDNLSSAEDEREFIRSMKEQGADGIISFYGLDIPDTVRLCEEQELYYVLGSGTLSDEDFQAVKDNPWFLGTVGPAPDAEYGAGKDMAIHFAQQNRKSYLVLTGGAATGNYMHASRAEGVLDGLAETLDLDFTGSAAECVKTPEDTVLETGSEISITLCPGYMTTEEGQNNLMAALESGVYDAVLGTYGINEILDEISEKEASQGSDIQVGAVDCFSEENYNAVRETDAFGNPKINYIEGKYASMVGPAFAILYNAITGHPEVNMPDGTAVRLYQGFWRASTKAEYIELYGYTQGIYENAYACEDLMDIIKVFNENAAPESVKALTESYTVEEVKERIANH